MGSLEQAQITGFLCRLCSKMHRAQFVIFIYGAEGKFSALFKYRLFFSSIFLFQGPNTN